MVMSAVHIANAMLIIERVQAGHLLLAIQATIGGIIIPDATDTSCGVGNGVTIAYSFFILSSFSIIAFSRLFIIV